MTDVARSGSALSELVGAAAVIAVCVALWHSPLAAPPPPRRVAPVAFIAVDGLTWPVLTPMLASGEAPALAGLQHAQHANLQGSGVIPLSELWLAGAVWEHAAKSGQVCAQLSWPSQPVARLWKPGAVGGPAVIIDLPPVTDELVVIPPGHEPLPPDMARRMIRDLGTATAVERLVKAQHVDYLTIGLGGPRDPSKATPGGRMAPIPDGYARMLDGVLGRIIAALGPGATIIVAGRGSGRHDLPHGQGIWLAAGPDLAEGPLPGPVRTTDLPATILTLLDVPLPAAIPGRPSPWIFAGGGQDCPPFRWALR